jgi:hypothetical protein
MDVMTGAVMGASMSIGIACEPMKPSGSAKAGTTHAQEQQLPCWDCIAEEAA